MKTFLFVALIPLIGCNDDRTVTQVAPEMCVSTCVSSMLYPLDGVAGDVVQRIHEVCQNKASSGRCFRVQGKGYTVFRVESELGQLDQRILRDER